MTGQVKLIRDGSRTEVAKVTGHCEDPDEIGRRSNPPITLVNKLTNCTDLAQGSFLPCNPLHYSIPDQVRSCMKFKFFKQPFPVCANGFWTER